MRGLWTLVLAAMLLGACRRDDASGMANATGASEPAQAVLLLTGHLRDNDLNGFARDAVPPALHRQLDSVWREARTRWPLDELPFDERLPPVLAALAETGSEQRLQRMFEHQFAGETHALKAAATTLGLFSAQYVRQQSDLSDSERAHYLQFVQAFSRWAAQAPLGDRARARTAIPRLTAAARTAGLRTEADFARLGMATSLTRLSGVLRAVKQVLANYGLPLDKTLGELQAETLWQRGDKARVRMRYVLGGAPVQAEVEAERIDGRWYLSDFLRHARQAAQPQDATPAADPGLGEPAPAETIQPKPDPTPAQTPPSGRDLT